ncbi:pectate lyase [Streptomyces boncukensis]|uniref:Pectate lyase n=1 Tax=Streptomyces boncukensis TaxID=2711219 RepID=A0A6G4X5U6_9ACTN|nr:pectate lyase [Streptomyces boncukensis]NGO72114.1 pectate lyase [Streptomyces boncukensis]
MANNHRRKLFTTRRSLIGGISAGVLVAGALTTTSMMSPASAAEWPTPSDDRRISETQEISGEVDGGMVRYIGEGDLGDGGQDEGQPPMFKLADGATLKNVILGAPAADGIHCSGSCTLENVWWEDVGEDAATFRGGNGATFQVIGGGARKAEDKVLQHNGGGTLKVRGFAVEDFGKLYRSCGNCSTQYERHVELDTIEVTAPGKDIVGINENFGDTARLRNITVKGDGDRRIRPCVRWQGKEGGGEPTESGSGPDGRHCLYSEGDISYE